MYAGHLGLAMAARRLSADAPLWLLVFAAQGPDWGDVFAELLRRPPPVPAWGSHGFVLVAAGALATAAVGAVLGSPGRRGRAALLVGTLYASHWVCDFVTGRKPTWPGGPTVGLDLYSRPAADLLLESAVVCGGWALWQATLPRQPRLAGRMLVGALLVALVVLQALANRAMARGGRLL